MICVRHEGDIKSIFDKYKLIDKAIAMIKTVQRKMKNKKN